MTVSLSFLGSFKAEADGTPLILSSRRGRALLAALALAPERCLTRERAAALLWPDRDEAHARASLRQELAGLRRVFGAAGAEPVLADAERIRLAEAGLGVDLWHFLDETAQPDAALGWWRGALLEDVDFPSVTYEEWRADERRALAARAVRLGEAALAEAAAGRAPDRLAAAAARLAALDPLNEAAVAALMRTAAAQGRQTEALRRYADHVAHLDRDLGAAPGAELTALRDQIAGAARTRVPRESRDVQGPEQAIFNRPAVLLMGFDALGPSDEDRTLALGLSGDLRTTLSYWRWFPVIGPEAIGWKTAQGCDLRETAESVGAAYAVSGELRRAGDRVRITANLTEVATGRSVWTQVFDGTLADIFAFQDEVSRQIVAQLEPELAHAEAERIARARPNDLSAWQLVLQAAESERRGGDGYGTPEANAEQKALLTEALERDPGLARAWSWVAKCFWRDVIMGWAPDRDAAMAACLDAAERAERIDPTDWESRAYRGLTYLFGLKQHGPAELHAREAVRLNPSAAQARHCLGCVTENTGKPAEALDHLWAVFRLNPNHPNAAAVLGDIATCNMILGDHGAATDAATRLVALAPGYSRGLQRAAAALALAGEAAAAADAVAKLRVVQPEFSEEYVRATYPFARAADLALFLEGLDRAGCWRR